jgi:hypothetical protein
MLCAINWYDVEKHLTNYAIFILGKEFFFQSFRPIIKTQRFCIKQSLGRLGLGA